LKLQHILRPKEIMHESGRAHRACAQVNHPSAFVNVRNASRLCATTGHASPLVLNALASLRQGRALLPFPAINNRKSGVGKTVQAVIVSQPPRENAEEMRTPLDNIVVVYFLQLVGWMCTM